MIKVDRTLTYEQHQAEEFSFFYVQKHGTFDQNNFLSFS